MGTHQNFQQVYFNHGESKSTLSKFWQCLSWRATTSVFLVVSSSPMWYHLPLTMEGMPPTFLTDAVNDAFPFIICSY